MFKSVFLGTPSRLSVAVLTFAVTVLAALAALGRATFPAVLGQAPHPDGDRYLCQLGSDQIQPDLANAPRYWSFALLQWHHTGIPQQRDCTSYPTSQVPLLKALEWFSSTVSGRPGTLDFSWLVLANAILIGVIAGLLAVAPRRASLLARSIACAGLVTILSDPIFAAYAAGPMGEYVGLVGIALLAVGAAFYAASGIRQPVGVVMVAAGGLLTLTSKVQAVTILIPLAVMLLLVPIGWRSGRRVSRIRLRQVLRIFVTRIVGAALIAVFAIVGSWMLANNPKKFQQINPWELISVGILGHSQTPGDDLVEMGFPRELDKYAGKTAGDENSIMFAPAWNMYADKMTYGTVLAFLAHHPDRIWPLIETASNDFFVAQPRYLGANQPGNGPAQEPAFSLMAAVGRSAGGLLEFVGAGLIVAVAAGIAWRRGSPGSSARAYAVAALLMVGVTFVQFFTAAFGEAIENTKHLVFAILASALAVPFVIASFLQPPRDDRTPVVSGEGIADAGIASRRDFDPDLAATETATST
ncbi:hypothetical protein A0130_07575 [Leifsonia xyli]|uniref:glycan biosynthesis hexose transferase WsfD n=1 Tax=Leifsonia xyli TaxID=1575 RepID=UPI0007CDB4AD|nr:hypothetical protein A0130_07575 [Leifsonia xyli]